MANEVDGEHIPSPVTDTAVEEKKEYISAVEKTVPCQPVMKSDSEAINIQELQTGYLDSRQRVIDREVEKFDERVETDKTTLVTETEKERSMKPKQQAEEDLEEELHGSSQPDILVDDHISSVKRVIEVSETAGFMYDRTTEETGLLAMEDDQQVEKPDATEDVQRQDAEMPTDSQMLQPSVTVESVTEKIVAEPESVLEAEQQEPVFVPEAVEAVDKTSVMLQQEEKETREPLQIETQETASNDQTEEMEQKKTEPAESTEQLQRQVFAETTSTETQETQKEVIATVKVKPDEVEEVLDVVTVPATHAQIDSWKYQPQQAPEELPKPLPAEQLVNVTSTEAETKDIVTVTEAVTEEIKPEEIQAKEKVEQEVPYKIAEEPLHISEDQMVTKVVESKSTTITETEVRVVTVKDDVESYKPVSEESVEELRSKESVQLEIEQLSETAEEPLANEVLSSETAVTEHAPVMEKEDMQPRRLESEVTTEDVSSVKTREEPEEIVQKPSAEQFPEEQELTTVADTEIVPVTAAKEVEISALEHEQVAEEMPPAKVDERMEEVIEACEETSLIESEDKARLADKIVTMTAVDAEDVRADTTITAIETEPVVDMEELVEEHTPEPAQVIEVATVEATDRETVTDESVATALPPVQAAEEIEQMATAVDTDVLQCVAETEVLTEIAKEGTKPDEFQAEEKIEEEVPYETAEKPLHIREEHERVADVMPPANVDEEMEATEESGEEIPLVESEDEALLADKVVAADDTVITETETEPVAEIKELVEQHKPEIEEAAEVATEEAICHKTVTTKLVTSDETVAPLVGTEVVTEQMATVSDTGVSPAAVRVEDMPYQVETSVEETLLTETAAELSEFQTAVEERPQEDYITEDTRVAETEILTEIAKEETKAYERWAEDEEVVPYETAEEPLHISEDEMVTKVAESTSTTITETEVPVVTVKDDVESYKPISEEVVEELHSKESAQLELEQPIETAEEPPANVDEKLETAEEVAEEIPFMESEDEALLAGKIVAADDTVITETEPVAEIKELVEHHKPEIEETAEVATVEAICHKTVTTKLVTSDETVAPLVDRDVVTEQMATVSDTEVSPAAERVEDIPYQVETREAVEETSLTETAAELSESQTAVEERPQEDYITEDTRVVETEVLTEIAKEETKAYERWAEDEEHVPYETAEEPLHISEDEIVTKVTESTSATITETEVRVVTVKDDVESYKPVSEEIVEELYSKESAQLEIEQPIETAEEPPANVDEKLEAAEEVAEEIPLIKSEDEALLAGKIVAADDTVITETVPVAEIKELAEQHKPEIEETAEVATEEAICHKTMTTKLVTSDETVAPLVGTEVVTEHMATASDTDVSLAAERVEDIPYQVETREAVEETSLTETAPELSKTQKVVEERPQEEDYITQDKRVAETEVLTAIAKDGAKPDELWAEEEVEEQVPYETAEEPLHISDDEMLTKVTESTSTTITETEVRLVTVKDDVESYKPVSEEVVEELHSKESAQLELEQPIETAEEPLAEEVLPFEIATERAPVMGKEDRQPYRLEPVVATEDVSSVEIQEEPEEIVQKPPAGRSPEEGKRITVADTEIVQVTVAKVVETSVAETDSVIETAIEEMKPYKSQAEENVEEEVHVGEPLHIGEEDMVTKVTETARTTVTDTEVRVVTVADDVESYKPVSEEAAEVATEELVEALDEQLATSQDEIVTGKAELTTTVDLAAKYKEQLHNEEDTFEELQSAERWHEEDQPEVGSTPEEVQKTTAISVAEVEMESHKLEAAEIVDNIPLVATQDDVVKSRDIAEQQLLISQQQVQEREHLEEIEDTSVTETDEDTKEVGKRKTFEQVPSELEESAIDREMLPGVVKEQPEQMVVPLLQDEDEQSESPETATQEAEPIMIKLVAEDSQAKEAIETYKPQHEHASMGAGLLQDEDMADITDVVAEKPLEAADIDVVTEFKTEEVMEPEEDVAALTVEATTVIRALPVKDEPLDVEAEMAETVLVTAETEGTNVEEEKAVHSAAKVTKTYELHDETELWTQSTVAHKITTRKIRMEEQEEVTDSLSEDIEPVVLQVPEAESSVSEEVHDDSMKAVAGDQISDEELESDIELLLEEHRIKYDISRTEAHDPLLDLLPEDTQKQKTVEDDDLMEPISAISGDKTELLEAEGLDTQQAAEIKKEKYEVYDEKLLSSSQEEQHVEVCAEKDIGLVRDEGILPAERQIPASFKTDAVTGEVADVTETETPAETITEAVGGDLRAVSSCMVEEMVQNVLQQTLVDDTGVVYPQTLSSETATFAVTEVKELTGSVADESASREHESLIEMEEKVDIEAGVLAADELDTSEEMVENDYTSDASIVVQMHMEEAQLLPTEAEPGSDEPDVTASEPDKVVQTSDEVDVSATGPLEAVPSDMSVIRTHDKVLSYETSKGVKLPDVEHIPRESEDKGDECLKVRDVVAMASTSSTDDKSEMIQEVASNLVSTVIKTAEELESSKKSPRQDDELRKSTKSREESVPKTLVAEGGRSTVVQVVRSIRSDGEIVEQVVTVDSASALEALGALPSPQTSLCGESGEELEPVAAASPSAVVVYTDTLEERPDSETEMSEYEEFLPDGTLVRRKVVKTTRHEAVTRRVVVDETPAEHRQSVGSDAPLTFLRYSDRAEEGPVTVMLSDDTVRDTLADGRSVVTHSTVTSQQTLVMERTFVGVLDRTDDANLKTMDNLLSSSETSGIEFLQH